jgi:hypothetical protein
VRPRRRAKRYTTIPTAKHPLEYPHLTPISRVPLENV